MICHLCKADVDEAGQHNRYLRGIKDTMTGTVLYWECAPSCTESFSSKEKMLLAAFTGTMKSPPPST